MTREILATPKSNALFDSCHTLQFCNTGLGREFKISDQFCIVNMLICRKKRISLGRPKRR
jgi:hypothetical protein